jgi:hypothetical protein
LSEGVLIYEIRVALSASEAQPYAVRSTPGGGREGGMREMKPIKAWIVVHLATPPP